MSHPNETSSQDDLEIEDVDEFSKEERRPFNEISFNQLRNKNEFVFDPENGGGRRRRTKKVSRIELLKLSSNFQSSSAPKEKSEDVSDSEEEAQVQKDSQPLSTMPMGVNPNLYRAEFEAKALTIIEEPRNPGKNSITPDTLA
jgi:hypothetical protein